MFTGLVETMGIIADIRRVGPGISLGVIPARRDFDVPVGASVALDGACLTMEQRSRNMLFFTAVYETLARTTLARAVRGTKINLERALAVGGRLDGHMVLGHVDGVGTMMADRAVGNSILRVFSIPSTLMPLMAVKGSVALDGVSLTIAAVEADTITVSLIPHTLSSSTMGDLRPGDAVNVECDVLARYVQRLLESRAAAQAGESHGDEDGEHLLRVMKRSGF
jgi:riboflavin synthase